MLDDGRLVRPIDDSLTRNNAVYVVIPSSPTVSPKVQNFIDWIVAEAAGNAEHVDDRQEVASNN